MLLVTVVSRADTQQLTHRAGPLEVGRGPARAGLPRLALGDAFVSRDHLRLDELPDRGLRLTNLSSRGAVAVDQHSLLTPGQTGEYKLPVRLGVGETVLDIGYAAAEPSAVPVRSVAPTGRHTTQNLSSLLAQEGVPLVELVGWLGSVLTVQRATAPADLFTLTAKALVNQIGVDTGVVLLTDGTAWRVVAKETRDDQVLNRPFSHHLLERVLREKRTCYLTADAAADGSDSLDGVSSVVASPVLSADGAVVGAVYGSRHLKVRDKDIGPLEAQVVQILASTVGAGLARAATDAEADRLRVAKEAAEQADRAKGQFLAVVSHELRTPLTTILGYAEMLQEQTAADGRPEYAPDLHQIHAAAGHLLTLINDLLDFSKIEAGKMPLAHEPFDPARLVREIAAAADPLARTHQNRLVVECPADLGPGVGDATRLRQCVLNLLGNACKFTAAGRVTLAAEATTHAGRAAVRVSVADTGVGMNPEQVGRLFQPFVQVDAGLARTHGGTGLGLAITRKLVEAMGGEVTVASEVGKGSTFTLVVPV